MLSGRHQRNNIWYRFFYKGDEKWDNKIPNVGKEAEKGCEGCPWYDIEEWRLHLNKLIRNSEGNED